MRELFAVLVSLTLFSCATTPVKIDPKKYSAERLFKIVCRKSPDRNVRGSIMMKASSDEASGQFPASVEVKNRKTLRMEITNLLGGTEALIKVEGDYYEILIPDREARKYEGRKHWAGIPLRWAIDLFLGNFPCTDAKPKDRVLILNENSELEVKVPGETYTYRFKEHLRSYWPIELKWKRSKRPEETVTFEFHEPEKREKIPMRWSADSVKGSVKVKWINRRSFR